MLLNLFFDTSASLAEQNTFRTLQIAAGTAAI